VTLTAQTTYTFYTLDGYSDLLHYPDQLPWKVVVTVGAKPECAAASLREACEEAAKAYNTYHHDSWDDWPVFLMAVQSESGCAYQCLIGVRLSPSFHTIEIAPITSDPQKA
jgi:hypothetical protein